MARLPLTNRNRPRGLSIIHDNYCIDCGWQEQLCACDRQNGQFKCCTSGGWKEELSACDQQERDSNFLSVNSCVVTHVHFAKGYMQKKGINPDNGHRPEIKYVSYLAPSGKQITQKLPGIKSCLYGPKGAPGTMFLQYSSHSNRQHNSVCLHKQGGGDEGEA